jgi:Flp pilus assembly protein TadG
MRIPRKITSTAAGSAAVEFALILPMIMLLVAGLLDYGNVMTIRMKVNSAARAAVQYAARYPGDAAAITAAGTAATNDANVAVGAPNLFCTCRQPWGVANSFLLDSCASPCVDPQGAYTKFYYVTVAATESYTPLLPYKGLGAAIVLAGSASMEVQ